VSLQFDKVSHTYRVDGRLVPSVTQVLDPLLELDGVPRDVLEAARIFGQHVHEACHLLVRGELDWSRLSPALVPYIEGARNFLRECGIVVIASELALSGCDAGVASAGTLDFAGILPREDIESIFDWKSTSAVPRTVGPQTAAYERFYRAKRGGRQRKRFCVQLRDDRTYRLIPLTDPADWNIFLSALNLHHWRHKNVAA
jgi:hypothetical protein